MIVVPSSDVWGGIKLCTKCEAVGYCSEPCRLQVGCHNPVLVSELENPTAGPGPPPGGVRPGGRMQQETVPPQGVVHRQGVSQGNTPCVTETRFCSQIRQ